MNLIKTKWTEKDYEEYIEYLISIKEESYKLFSEKLTPTKYEMLGIRIPLQRKIAKEISKGNYREFLKLVKNKYYEEINIEGFIIGNIKEKEEVLEYIDFFVSKIDNWAICDCFCNSLKIVEKHQEEFFDKIKLYLQSKKEFTVRVGLVLLLSHYVKDEYIKDILEIANSLNREEYYINMALAWLLAECYVKSRSLTKKFLENNQLNKFTQNKTISKICDSYRVTKEEKDYLKALRK